MKQTCITSISMNPSIKKENTFQEPCSILLSSITN